MENNALNILEEYLTHLHSCSIHNCQQYSDGLDGKDVDCDCGLIEKFNKIKKSQNNPQERVVRQGDSSADVLLAEGVKEIKRFMVIEHDGSRIIYRHEKPKITIDGNTLKIFLTTLPSK